MRTNYVLLIQSKVNVPKILYSLIMSSAMSFLSIVLSTVRMSWYFQYFWRCSSCHFFRSVVVWFFSFLFSSWARVMSSFGIPSSTKHRSLLSFVNFKLNLSMTLSISTIQIQIALYHLYRRYLISIWHVKVSSVQCKVLIRKFWRYQRHNNKL